MSKFQIMGVCWLFYTHKTIVKYTIVFALSASVTVDVRVGDGG